MKTPSYSRILTAVNPEASFAAAGSKNIRQRNGRCQEDGAGLLFLRGDGARSLSDQWGHSRVSCANAVLGFGGVIGFDGKADEVMALVASLQLVGEMPDFSQRIFCRVWISILVEFDFVDVADGYFVQHR